MPQGGVAPAGGGGGHGGNNPNPAAIAAAAASAMAMIQNNTTPNQHPMMMMAMNPQQEKINRELFVGNTPPGTSELLLLHYLNAAMRRAGLCQPHETPIINSRVNNKFAFIELQSMEMTKQALSLNGIPFVGGIYLKVSRPSKYIGPDVNLQVPTWQQVTNQQGVSPLLDPEQEKLSRELFIGNTTPEMTDVMIQEFLGTSLQQVGLATAPGNPITACRVSGKYAFVELRSAEEATNMLNLNNIPFMGTALRVGRPSKWNGPVENHGNWEDILAKVMSGELQFQSTDGTNANDNTTSAAAPSASSIHQNPPSRIVELQNMLTAQDIENDQDFADIKDDIQEECSNFGQLLSIYIPRNIATSGVEQNNPRVFLEYASNDDAGQAITQLQGRTFDGRQVIADYYDETEFGKLQQQ